VFVLLVDLVIPVNEDSIAVTTWMKMSGDLGSTVTVVVLT
jgi:hypothetical protein